MLNIQRVDIVIRYIEVDFTFRLPEYVRYIEVLFHTFYCNFGRDFKLSFVISRTSLNRGFTVLLLGKSIDTEKRKRVLYRGWALDRERCDVFIYDLFLHCQRYSLICYFMFVTSTTLQHFSKQVLIVQLFT